MVSTVKISTTAMGFSVEVSKGGTIKGTSLNIYGYSRKFEYWTYDRVAMRRILESEFYQFYPNQEICFFPKYDIEDFCSFIKRNGFEYVIEERTPVTGSIKPFNMLPHITYKNDKQKNAVEYLCDDTKGPVRALALQTGVGKTVSLIMALQKMQSRALVTMSSRLEQWVDSIKTFTSMDDDDIYVIRGLGSISKLFSQIDKEIRPKVILASTKTMRLYIDYSATYSELPHPSQICENLNVGVVATDEYHEHFFSNYLINLVANPKVFIPITATFIANDPFVRNIFDGMIPDDTKFTGGEYHKFVNVTSYTYESAGMFIKPYNYTARGGYSQVMFEEYLLTRGRKLLEKLIEDCIIPIIREHYIDIREKGEKFLFLCATKKFGDYISGVFKRSFDSCTVSTFYSGDPTTKLDHFDMIVSTPGSAGTGRDIKGLRTCFVFENTASEIRNTQYLGRLRGPPHMLNEPEFVYLSLSCIPQHAKYAVMRAFLYGSKAKTLKHRRIT